MASSRRRTAPNTPLESDFAAEPPGIGLGLEDQPQEFDPEMPAQMAFFAKLRDYPPELWGDALKLYLYRIDPPVANAGDKKYIDWFPRAITEAEIKEKHGGGKYQVWLRDESVKPAKVTKCTFYIDGPARFLPGQTLRGTDATTIDATTGATISPIAPGAAAAENTKAMAEVLNRALEMLQQGKSTTADDALKAAMDTMSLVQKKSVEMMADSFKQQAGSTTGHPLLDQLLQAAISNMLKPPEVKSPTATLREALELLNEMRKATGGEVTTAEPRRGSLLEEARAIAELKKVDSDGSLIKALFGRGGDDDDDREETSVAMKGLGLLEKVLTLRPDIVDSGANLLKRFAGPGPQQYATAAHNPAPPTPAPQQLTGTNAPSTTPAALVNTVRESSAPSQGGEALPANVDAVLQTIVQSYRNNMDGSAVAAALATLYPDTIPVLRQYLGFPDVVVNAWLSSQPAIAPLMKEPQFPEFFAEFKGAIEGNLDDEEDLEEEGDEPRAAAAEGIH